MTKICFLFIGLLTVAITQCADEQKNDAHISLKKDKVRRIFNAIGQDEEFEHLINKYPSLINAYSENNGSTPLLQLLNHGRFSGKFNTGRIKFLLEKGADVEASNENETWTPLTFIACFSFSPGAFEIVQLLIDFHADVNAYPKAFTKDSPLGMAAINCGNNTDMVELLLNNGAD